MACRGENTALISHQAARRMRAKHETRITNHGLNLHFSPRGEAKWVRGPSGRGASRAEEKGASRLARAGVLEQYVEHGKQAQRSPGGRIACFDRWVVRNADYRFSGRQVFPLERTRPLPLVFTKHETRNTAFLAVRAAVPAVKSLLSDSRLPAIAHYCPALLPPSCCCLQWRAIAGLSCRQAAAARNGPVFPGFLAARSRFACPR